MSKLMTFILVLLSSVILITIYSSCNNNRTFITPEATKFTELNISSDFKFETTREVLVALQVERIIEKEPPHKFYIYIGNPNEGGKLLTSGITDPYLSFQTKLVLPTNVNELQIRKQDINGAIETVTLDISTGSASYIFTGNKSTVYNNLKSTNDDDEDCDDCDQNVSGTYQNLTIDDETFCVPEDSSLTVQNLKLKNEGKLIICGTASVTNVTPQGQDGGRIHVSTGGVFSVINFNTNKLEKFVNYGTTAISNNLNVHQSSEIKNYYIMNIAGSVTNDSEDFINNTDGVMNISGHFNNNEVVYNYGTITITGHLNNNGAPDVEFYNYCKLIANGDFNQNQYFFNGGYVEVGQNTRLNGNSETEMDPQAFISTDNIHINGDLIGPDVPCARINVATTTNINGSGEISGYMDICDADGIENNNGTIGDNVTFDCDCYIAATACNVGSGTPSLPNDEDGDGCPDDQDDYPNDPERCSNEYYPNETDYTNLAFEDLWTGLGDYDFNDLIVETNYKFVKSGQNKIVEIYGKFHIVAVGADLNNGFAIEFDIPTIAFDSVSGTEINGSAVTINDNGVEQGPLNKAVVIVYDAITDYLETSMVNTIPGGNYIDIDTITVYMKFATPQNSVGTPPFNPFMFVNQVRGKEIHLIDHLPTELVDITYFGQDADNSIPEQGRYYVTSTNLPWVIEIPQQFNYPIEKADIINAHLKFRDWAESSGQLFPDWYEDLPGYRNDAFIYQKPQ